MIEFIIWVLFTIFIFFFGIWFLFNTQKGIDMLMSSGAKMHDIRKDLDLTSTEQPLQSPSKWNFFMGKVIAIVSILIGLVGLWIVIMDYILK